MDDQNQSNASLPLSDSLASDQALRHLLDSLRATYTPAKVPPCRVCGGALSVQQEGGGEPTVWACSGFEDDPDRPGYMRVREGRFQKRPAGAPDEYRPGGHFHDSQWTVWRAGDSRVIELVDLAERMLGLANRSQSAA